MKQFNLGRWPGAYYSQLINGLTIISVGSSIVNLTVLWAVTQDQIKRWFPWLNYALFLGIILFIVMVFLPLIDYMFLYKTRQAFLNEQGYKHKNPFREDIDLIKADLKELLEKDKRNDA